MARRDLRGLFQSLDAELDAAIAREEDDAASDLAFSLLQDRSIRELLAGRPSVAAVLADEITVPVSVVGRDYIGCGEPLTILVPLAHAVVVESSGHCLVEVRDDDDMLSRLRSWARARVSVEVMTRQGRFVGTLLPVGRDHLALERPIGRVIVPLQALLSIRAVGGGSGDAL